MARKARRTDEDLVKEIVEYLRTRSGTVSRGELCSALDIHSTTAEKWLMIGLMFLNQCPPFEYDKAGLFGIITVKEAQTA